MSLSLTLNGNSSSLENTFFPPISLDGNWEIGLLNLETFNSIPNVNFGRIQVEEKLLIIPQGAYEISDIANLANEEFGRNVVNIKGNKNTLKTEVYCTKICKIYDEVAYLMGFDGSTIFEPNVLYVSPNPANICAINVIRVDCSIAAGAYLNGKKTHTIHEFFPSVAPGFKISEAPFIVLYHCINTKELSTLKIDILDQEGRHINLRGETVTIRVHLRQR